MRPNKLAVATFVTTLVFATLSFSPARAEACSVLTGWELPHEGLQLPQTVPTDGVVPVHMIAWYVSIDDELPTIDVTDSDGEAVAGSVSWVEFDARSGGGFGDRQDVVVVWKPDSDLDAESTYTYRLRIEDNDAVGPIDEETTFQTQAGATPALEAVELDATAAITEREAGFECCNDDSFCGSCDRDNCSKCWPTRYAYLPTIDAVANWPTPDAGAQVYHQVRANGQVRDRIWQPDPDQLLSQAFDEDTTGAFCVDVVTISLRDGSSVTSDETCFEREDLPSYNQRTLEASPPKVCADKMNNAQNDDTWSCSTPGRRADPTPGILIFLAAIVLAAGTLRRRTAH